MLKRSVLFIAFYFLTALLLFLLVQKPLFLIYNILSGMECPSSHQLWQIYSHGLVLDVSAACYVTAPAFLIVFFGAFIKKLNVRRVVIVYSVVIGILVALAALADAALYEFWGFKLDPTVFFYLDNPRNAVASVSLGYLFVRLLLWVVLSAVWALALSLPAKKWLSQRWEKRPAWYVSLPVLLITGGLLFAGIRGLRSMPNTPTRATFTNQAFLNHVALNPLFNLIYNLDKINSFEDEFRVFSSEQVAAELPKLFPTEGQTSIKLLNTERPNILLIVMESFGSPFIETLGGRKDVAPHISKLADEGVVFTRCYCGSYRTDRGIVCVLSGFPGQPTTSIIRHRRRAATLPGIPARLKPLGYETMAVYAGDITYFNMYDYFFSTGHDEVLGDTSFPDSVNTQEWGIPDGVIADWLYNDIADNKAKTGKPWFTTWLTLSSHGPWDVPYHRLADEELNGFAYTDEVIGQLIAKLKQTAAWDNLLVVLVADHGFRGKGLSAQDADFPFIPLIFCGGAVKAPMRINTLCSQTDLAATLLGQMGIKHNEFKFSRDVLADTYTYPFAYQTFNNGFNFRDSTGCTVYDNAAETFLFGEDTRRDMLGKLILQGIYEDLAAR